MTIQMIEMIGVRAISEGKVAAKEQRKLLRGLF